MSDLRHPESDQERAEKPDYLVLVGVCRLGCVPPSQKTGEVAEIMMAGSVPAMVRITTPLVEFVKAQRQQTLKCRPTLFSLMR